MSSRYPVLMLYVLVGCALGGNHRPESLRGLQRSQINIFVILPTVIAHVMPQLVRSSNFGGNDSDTLEVPIRVESAGQAVLYRLIQRCSVLTFSMVLIAPP